MKLSRSWIADYVDLAGISDADLEKRLTEIGHAVESHERHGDELVLDLEITTNRVDAMSHFGMARELSAALARRLVAPEEAPIARAEEVGAVSIRIDAPDACRRFTALPISGVTIRPSPEHVRRRLESVGLRAINNVVDATNYAMLALGHPLHAYDRSRIAGDTIVVRRGSPGEKLQTLDGVTRSLDADAIVIGDASGAIGLGGIIGGHDSEITQSTRDIVLECAWFDPSIVRRTARRLGIRTDASYRFERAVDPADTVAAVRMAAALILETAGGRAGEILDVRAGSEKALTLELRSSTLARSSAGAVGDGYALELLRRLQFAAEAVDGGTRVAVPSWRSDIREEMDLVEEVLRFFGFDRIPAELPRLTTGDARPNVLATAEDDVREILVGCGGTEVVTYSFQSANAGAAFSEEQPIIILNSLSENIAVMRTSLLAGLLETVAFNRSYGNRDAILFEVGRTYHRMGEGVRERRRAGFALAGNASSFWGDGKRPYDFFDLKGIVERIGAAFHVPLQFAAGEASSLRPGRRAAVFAGDTAIGFLGAVSPQIAERFSLRGDVFVAELDLERLLAARSEWTMAPVSRHPGVPMILAMTHDAGLTYARIVEVIRSFEVPHLHEIGLRDRFVAENQPSTAKTTIGMWYQAFDRSLTQEEVADEHARLASRLASSLPVQLLS